jgi:hypothetical protein
LWQVPAPPVRPASGAGGATGEFTPLVQEHHGSHDDRPEQEKITTDNERSTAVTHVTLVGVGIVRIPQIPMINAPALTTRS